MVCGLERVLRECDGFFISMSSVWFSAVVTVEAQTRYFVCASYLYRKSMK